MNLNNIIKSARGMEQADLLLTNARIVNVFSGEIISGSVAVAGGYIAGFGDYSAKKTVDIGGRYLCPGFIDAHVHIESAMVCPGWFARAILPHGTTSVVADPHEIANVLGAEGIQYMLQASEKQPANIYFALPSCVPATDMETSGARLNKDDLLPFINHDRVTALGEMMNYPGVINQDPEVLDKITMAIASRKPADGHAPGLAGGDLYAYIAAGISSDHECTTPQEAMEKLRAGMHIMIREGTSEKNLEHLLPIVNEKTFQRIMWCTDDSSPHDLMEQGHIDSMIRRAINSGLDPVIAIRMATINPARYFGINDAGAIAPGKRADLLVFSDIKNPHMEQVYSGGILVAEHGKILSEIETPEPVSVPMSVNIKVEDADFSIPAKTNRAKVINIIPDQLITHQSIMDVSVSGNMAVPDTSRDMLKIAVVERHSGLAKTGKGFVKGFGLKKGALASSVAHDSHNIILVGTNDADMKAALKCVVEMGGGLAAACDQKICASLALPIAGLMSQDPVNVVRDKLNRLIDVAREFGAVLNDPFMTIAFMALPVIPDLKITDKGLVDVRLFKIVPLFVD
ncbi:MAG: adenine deaminase [Desulfobacterales bacterium]|nr:adenine deaminase [Desulfobacterales bacterium]